MKWAPIEKQPRRITVATIVHIPELDGFWEESLEVLKLCFESLHQNTRPEFDLMVFDNGSCDEVQAYLKTERDAGRIQFLIFSEYNLRKLGAVKFMLAAAPGEIISVADSDVYFMPGWLEATLQVMDAFPEAGQVSALPTADKAFESCDHTYEAISTDPTIRVKKGPNLIPQHFIDAHRVSIGKTPEQYARSCGRREDTLVTRGDVSAFVSAQDFQFTTTRRVVDAVGGLEVRHPDEYFDPVYSPVFEARVDQKGFLRLSTTDYLIHHIGNKMPDLAEGLDWIFQEGLKASSPKPEQKQSRTLKRRLFRNRYSRRLLKRINVFTYALLYEI